MASDCANVDWAAWVAQLDTAQLCRLKEVVDARLESLAKVDFVATLPHEVAVCILLLLDAPALARASRASRHYNTLCRNLWMPLAYSLGFSADPAFYSASLDYKFWLSCAVSLFKRDSNFRFNCPVTAESRRFDITQGYVRSIINVSCMAVNNQVLVCGSIKIYDLNTQEILAQLHIHTNVVTSILIIGTTTYSSGADLHVRSTNWTKSTRLFDIPTPSMTLALCMSDNMLIASCVSGHVFYLDPASGDLLFELRFNRNVSGVVASPAGRCKASRLFVNLGDQVVVVSISKLWSGVVEMEEGKEGWGGGFQIQGFNVIAGNSRFLAVANGERISLYDASNLRLLWADFGQLGYRSEMKIAISEDSLCFVNLPGKG
ncbi:hypothetical protein HK096_003130, partial [Nowakowskiella sp. JEL0078]